ncbi:MAG: 2'-5' RNA ligase family protein [Solirubrobacterales bacterium]
MSVAQTAFALNWALTSRWLRASGTRIRERRAPEIGAPRYLTTVVRLPPEVSEPLAEAAARTAGERSGHYLYPPHTIHLTVVSLDACSEPEPMVESALAGHPGFEVEVGGLNVSRDTVFAELRPIGPALKAIRRDLRVGESSEHGAASRWLRRRLVHTNLIRFGGPVGPGLIDRVARLRRARFGSFQVAEVELARTDKVLSDAATRPLDAFRLG